MKQFDLHMHSAYSKDGEWTPTQLIQLAKQKGLEVVALTDHDCMLGIDEMMREGKRNGIQVIPGIEFSTLFQDDIECHLLGYGFDYKQSYFQTLHIQTQRLMDDAFHLRVQRLEETYGVEIDEAQVLADAHGENPWFLLCERMFNDPRNAHIADFADYRKGGWRSDPAPVNFFWDRCQKGSPLYVHVAFPSFRETVQRIHEAGGIAVLAHPFRTFYQKEERLQEAIAAGVDGIEAYSNYHEPKHNEYYAAYARAHGLLISCGSDFHGKHKPSIEMGSYGTVTLDKTKLLEDFLQALTAHRRIVL